MIKKWYKYYVLNQSIKEIELNRILDKISDSKELTERENNFLNLYNDTHEIDHKDFSHLSRNSVCDKINDYLLRKKKVYCDLCDKDGKISELILKIDEFKLILRHGNYMLEDKYLYNITYDIKKDEYSLSSQDEYFEEITV